jgi:hypothetical protein
MSPTHLHGMLLNAWTGLCYSQVCILTMLWAGSPDSNPGRAEDFVSAATARPGLQPSQSHNQSISYQGGGLFPWVGGVTWDMKMTSHLHPVPSLRMYECLAWHGA